MAHQWFGNLVTMVWWNDLWLNESFANWMEAKALDQLHRDWKIWLWEAGGRESAMRLDATSATHPVVQPAETLDQVNEIGDSIVYDKGAAVVRMLEAYVGADAWQRGVQSYIRRYKYANATGADLWREIEAAAPGKTVSAVARDFTEQDGLPMVRADIAAGPPAAALELSEARFAADAASKGERSWRIPVLAVPVAGGPVSQTIVAGGLPPSLLAGPGPLVANASQVGYYRSYYSPPAFKPVADGLAVLQPADQLGLIFDSWALAEAGYAPAANFMVLVERLPADADPRVWEQVLRIIGQIDRLYAGLSEREMFHAWARQRLAPLMERVGWAAPVPAADRYAVLRDGLLTSLGELDDPTVTAEARVRFEHFLNDAQSLPPDIRQAVLAIVGRHADPATFARLRALARDATDPQEKLQYLEALAEVSDPAIAEQVLAISLTAEVPATLAPVMISAVSVDAPEIAWRFALAHEADITGRLDPSQKLRFIPSLLSTSADLRLADELQSYAARTYPPDGRREAAKIEAAIRQQAETRLLRLPEITQWLSARGG